MSRVIGLARRTRGRGIVGGVATTTINAQIVNYGATTSGTLRFTGIFETPPGLLTDAMVTARQVAIWKGGVEVACHIEAARGHHPGGTYLRGFRYDFDYAVSDANPVTGFTVVIGTARTSTDISRRSIVTAQFTARRWLVGTDPSYLTTTMATGMPLVPASSWNAHETAWLKTKVDSAITARNTQPTDGNKAGAACYNVGRVYKNLFLCTGDPSYLNEMWLAVKRWLDVYHITVGTDTDGRGDATHIDQEGLGIYATQFSEARSIVEWDFPLLYMLTGWSQLWLLANNYGQRATRPAALSTTNHFNEQYGVRFNLRYLRHAPAAQRFDCTWIYSNPDYSARTPDLPAELPNLLSALDFNKYDTSRGAYRANLRGQHTGVVNSDLDVSWGAGNGDLPNFWLAIVNDWLIDYYRTIYADSRIPSWVGVNMGIALANASALPSNHYYVANFSDPTKYAFPYRQTGTAVTSLGADGGPSVSLETHDPFAICMFSRSAAFLSVNDGGATYNGKTAAQWLDIMTTPGQMSGMIWNDKFIGETFQAFDAPYYRLNGDPGGPASIHTPTTFSSSPS